MLVLTKKPGDKLLHWKFQNWPPAGMKQVNGLPIYIGEHHDVENFALSLGEVMSSVSDHVHDDCRGKTPRWMQVPKVIFGVERINLVQATAKASKRFTSLDELFKRCGGVTQQDAARLERWVSDHPLAELITHKEFTDLRAYVFSAEHKPQRLRFYESGLVLAPRAGNEVLVQDHRAVVRAKRSDGYAAPIARTSNGWAVFPALMP